MMRIKFSFFGEELFTEMERSHYMRRLGFPKDHEVEEHVQEAMDWSYQWFLENGNAWLHLYELDVEMKNEQLYLNKKKTLAPKVYKRFYKYGVEKAILIAVTAGDKVDKKSSDLWSSDFPDRAFFLETFASGVTETLVEFAVDQIKKWTNNKQENVLSRYSPGYPGWELNEQKTLMEIIGNNSKIPISVSETSLLSPLKSQLSLVGIYKGEQKENTIKIECMQCSFDNCSCRKKEMYIKI